MIANERSSASAMGFVDGHSHTCRDLSKMFGVSRERVRQIECAALGKLQLPKTAGKLVGFLEMPLQSELRN